MVKNLFGELANDLSIKSLMQKFGRFSFDSSSQLRTVTSGTLTTASAHTTRSIGGKGYSIISSKDTTMRIYEYDPSLSRLHPKMNQWLYPTGSPVQGDRATCLRSPDEVEFYYLLLPSSTAFVRCALIDS